MSYLTASELIEILKSVPPNTPIVLSSDAEGNSYRKSSAVSTDYNFDDDDDVIGLRELTDEDRESGYTEEDIMSSGVPVVVLS